MAYLQLEQNNATLWNNFLNIVWLQVILEV